MDVRSADVPHAEVPHADLQQVDVQRAEKGARGDWVWYSAPPVTEGLVEFTLINNSAAELPTTNGFSSPFVNTERANEQGAVSIPHSYESEEDEWIQFELVSRLYDKPFYALAPPSVSPLCAAVGDAGERRTEQQYAQRGRSDGLEMPPAPMAASRKTVIASKDNTATQIKCSKRLRRNDTSETHLQNGTLLYYLTSTNKTVECFPRHRVAASDASLNGRVTRSQVKHLGNAADAT